LITIDDFRKVELRVGRVLAAEPHPNADRLLVVKVDLGASSGRWSPGSARAIPIRRRSSGAT